MSVMKSWLLVSRLPYTKEYRVDATGLWTAVSPRNYYRAHSMTRGHNLNTKRCNRIKWVEQALSNLPNCNIPIETVSRKQVVNFELSLP
jgi:hypothetical protein